MRPDVAHVASRDLGNRAPSTLLERLSTLLSDDESVELLIPGAERNSLIALSSQSLYCVGAGWEFVRGLAELRDVVLLPDTAKRALLCALRPEESVSGIGVPIEEGRTLRNAAQSALRAQPAEGTPGAWYQDRSFSIATRLHPVGVLVAPPGSPLHGQTPIALSVVTTGLQMTAYDRLRADDVAAASEFVAYAHVRNAIVEGADQVTQRPSVGAVLAFGVLGLAARRTERRAYLTISAEPGEYVFEVPDLLPTQLRALLKPLLDRVAESSDPAPALTPADEDPIETIRRLGELRDAGFLSGDEFEEKKADLLRRI